MVGSAAWRPALPAKSTTTPSPPATSSETPQRSRLIKDGETDASEAGIYGGTPKDYAAALMKARRRAARPEGAS